MSRITSGGRPNQKADVGSTWVAWALSASPRTWVNPVTSMVVVNGSVLVMRASHLSSKGDSRPSSPNFSWIWRKRSPDHTE